MSAGQRAPLPVSIACIPDMTRYVGEFGAGRLDVGAAAGGG